MSLWGKHHIKILHIISLALGHCSECITFLLLFTVNKRSSPQAMRRWCKCLITSDNEWNILESRQYKLKVNHLSKFANNTNTQDCVSYFDCDDINHTLSLELTATELLATKHLATRVPRGIWQWSTFWCSSVLKMYEWKVQALSSATSSKEN